MGNCHSDTAINTEDEDGSMPPSPVSIASHRFFNVRPAQIVHEASKSSFESCGISETKRLQSQYSYMSNLWESKFYSPINQKLRDGGMKVLDIGCGTGEWILDMAREYPNTKFYGLDLSPNYQTSSLPENVEFYQGNLLEGLPFEDVTFDFVHMSLLVRWLTTKQWEDVVIRELVRVTKPFGFIELMEGDLTLHNQGPVTMKLQEAFLASMHARGISPMIETIITRILTTNPYLEDLHVETRTGLLNKWDGLNSLENGLQVFKTLKKSNLEFMSVTSSEYDDMLTSYVKEVEEYNTHCKFYRFYVRKVDHANAHNHFNETIRSSSTHFRNASKSNPPSLSRNHSTNTNNIFSSSTSQTSRRSSLKTNSLRSVNSLKRYSSKQKL
ncbi:12938_t:CDS:2 [Acaulospora morrowiae]|uniref:12938_t:CDS:1 n=1 Tax=Acaulospora morrowiae TaxID=94023 RepID=A0A9N9F1M6_9GLOM|nr:12938_t:CDS:2 [Acaulospora morrowiae]